MALHAPLLWSLLLLLWTNRSFRSGSNLPCSLNKVQKLFKISCVLFQRLCPWFLNHCSSTYTLCFPVCWEVIPSFILDVFRPFLLLKIGTCVQSLRISILVNITATFEARPNKMGKTWSMYLVKLYLLIWYQAYPISLHLVIHESHLISQALKIIFCRASTISHFSFFFF